MCYVAVTSGGEQDVVFGGRIQNFRNYLLIASVQKDDSGTYKCHAVNIKGEDSAQAQLTVISTLFAALVMYHLFWCLDEHSYLRIQIIAVLRYPAPVPYAAVSLSFVAFSPKKESISSFHVCFHFFFFF